MTYTPNYKKSSHSSPFSFAAFYASYSDKFKHRKLPEQLQLEQFIGFVDSKGCFTYSKGYPKFTINQTDQNSQVLDDIRHNLGIGYVRHNPKTGISYFTVGKRDELLILIQLLNGHLILPSRKEKFRIQLGKYFEEGGSQKYGNHFNDQTLKVTTQDAQFSGFADGKGVFYCSISEKTGGALSFNFTLTQKVTTDGEVFNQIAHLFNGKVSTRYKNSPNRLPVYMLYIGGLKKTASLIKYFDEFKFYTKKKSHSYRMQKAVHKVLYKKDHRKFEFQRSTARVKASLINDFTKLKNEHKEYMSNRELVNGVFF